MGVLDYFKPVSTWTADKVDEYIREHDDGAYNLVDVRQPGEFEGGHLPGAVLIPVGQLDERVAELDPAKPTIVYCAAGVRSRAAASVLERAGFPEVYSMAGGINAWNGLVAEGVPEAGISWFSEAHSLDELTALAWVLEDGTETFYETAAHAAGDPEAAALFRRLVQAEEGHKAMIARLQKEISGDAGEVDFYALLGGYPAEQVMEGGMRVAEAVAWAEGRGTKEVLELAISLEAGSYDRYLALLRRASYEKSRTLFKALADEEKRHLGLLTELYEKYL